jgi:hypothetical protein
LSIPDQDKLQLLAEWLDVEPHILRFGELAGRAAKPRRRWDAGISYLEREVFEAFLKLPVAQRRVIRDVVLTYLRAYPASDQA